MTYSDAPELITSFSPEAIGIPSPGPVGDETAASPNLTYATEAPALKTITAVEIPTLTLVPTAPTGTSDRPVSEVRIEQLSEENSSWVIFAGSTTLLIFFIALSLKRS